jgi:hypothetical protein
MEHEGQRDGEGRTITWMRRFGAEGKEMRLPRRGHRPHRRFQKAPGVGGSAERDRILGQQHGHDDGKAAGRSVPAGGENCQASVCLKHQHDAAPDPIRARSRGSHRRIRRRWRSVAAPATPIGIAKARIDLPVEPVDDVPGPCVLHFAGRHWHILLRTCSAPQACWARCAPLRRCRRTR